MRRSFLAPLSSFFWVELFLRQKASLSSLAYAESRFYWSSLTRGCESVAVKDALA